MLVVAILPLPGLDGQACKHRLVPASGPCFAPDNTFPADTPKSLILRWKLPAGLAGERKVTVGARLGLGRVNSACAGPGDYTLSEPRRLNAEVLAAAGQLKPVTIEALLRGGPGTGLGA
jgi:hypothetical protein